MQHNMGLCCTDKRGEGGGSVTSYFFGGGLGRRQENCELMWRNGLCRLDGFENLEATDGYMTIIDEIKDRIRIEDLVAETATVRLRKSGANFTGFCPFHVNHDTPALVVFAGTGTWKCFGACNEGGDVFDWVIKQNPGYDLKEAIRHLAGKAGITLKGEADNLGQRISARAKESALRVAQGVFKKWLMADEAALAYALDRGWTLETIKLAGIGFSGRATAEAYKEMQGEFTMHGIDLLSPEAVLVLGFKGDVEKWARAHEIDPKGLADNYIQGMMSKPGLMYAHKFDGKIEYLSSRLLPGFDGERKSHNPNSTLAGPRRPYFNWRYKAHHVVGQAKGDLIHIVEGQGDAVTWGQFGDAAMALCGSSWQYLIESGIIDRLKEEYEEISYSVDADTPGETVVRGKKDDFPLSSAFGGMLWIERTPKIEWTRADGHVKALKDVNDIAQYFMDAKIEPAERTQMVRDMVSKAEPIVLLAARYAGGQEGHFKEQALDKIVRPLILGMPNGTRINYASRLAEAFYPSLGKSERNLAYGRWLGGELKAAKNEESDDEDMPVVTTFGGWYPEDKAGNSGYLIDLWWDKANKKIRFAYAHITDMKTGAREIETAPYLVFGGKKYEPPDSDELIEVGVVKLASALGASRTSSQLIYKMAEYYEKFFYLEEKSRYKFCGAYSLFTWVFDSFLALNFLRARGGSGSGKSDLMYLVGLTSYRFAVTLSTSSSASYKGLAKMYNASVMIDEADNLMKKDDGTMEAFLKGRGMKRYANSLNMMEMMTPNGKVFVPSTSNVYGPTLITMYKSFADPGIENRCITFDLSQVDTLTLDKAGMEPGYYPPELEEEAEEIRNLCLRWRLETWMPEIELTPEQRKQYKLADPLVSPRVNQVLRPMKVLAVLQNDAKLLEDLKMIGRANYEDEMIKRAGSFEAVILRAALAADIAADAKMGLAPQASAEYAAKVKGYGDKVKIGKLGRHNTVRYILYKDLAGIANEIFDVENVADGAADDKKKQGVKSKTIGDVCRDSFRLPVERTGEGWAVILQRERLDIAKLRLGLDREAEYCTSSAGGTDTGSGGEAEKQVEPVQVDFIQPSEGAMFFNEDTGDWENH
jgi:hypothetical protein